MMPAWPPCLRVQKFVMYFIIACTPTSTYCEALCKNQHTVMCIQTNYSRTRIHGKLPVCIHLYPCWQGHVSESGMIKDLSVHDDVRVCGIYSASSSTDFGSHEWKNNLERNHIGSKKSAAFFLLCLTHSIFLSQHDSNEDHWAKVPAVWQMMWLHMYLDTWMLWFRSDEARNMHLDKHTNVYARFI